MTALVMAATMIASLAPLGAPGRAAAATLAAPTLSSPGSGASITGNPVFAWNAASGASKYTLTVSTASDFSSNVSGFPITTFNRNYAPPAELPNGQLYWRVAAVDAAGITGTYATDDFTKGWGTAPSPTSPAANAVLKFPTDPLLFSWNPLPGAQAYELEVDDADDFIGAIKYSTKNTLYTVTEPVTIDQSWYWRVRGASGSVYSAWSNPRSFKSAWPTKPTLIYPPADAKGITDTYFDWEPVLGADTYQLQVNPNVDFQNNMTIDKIVKSTRYDPPVPLNNGNYYWRVRAIDAAGAENIGPWSDDPSVMDDERVFQRGWPDKPTLAWPLDGGATSDQDLSDASWQNLTFSWDLNWVDEHATPHLTERGSWYRIRFGTGKMQVTEPTSGKTIDQLTGVLDRGCITNRTTWTPYVSASGINLVNPGLCTVSDADFTPSATYYWDVAALDSPVLNPSSVDIWGPPAQASSVIGLRSDVVRSFVFTPPEAVAGTPAVLTADQYLTPTRCDPRTGCSSTEKDTPVLSWTAIPGATSYTVRVSLDPNFTNIYRTYGTKFNRLAPRDSWKDNAANEAYYWNVTPNGVEFTVNSFSVFQKRTLPVARLSPASGSEQPNDFTMAWAPYVTANQAWTPPVDQEAAQYRITTSTVADFSSTLEAVTTNVPFYTPWSKTYAEGPVYWKVQAIDGSGNLLTQSAAGLVTKTSPVPTTTFPANGATQEGVPYLQWNPLAYAASYDVQLDNDQNFSSPIKTQTTKMSTWAYTDALGTGTYYWRVRRNDADGRDGAWSTTWSFNLKPNKPTLVAPANAANPSAYSLVMQWSATRPFAKYAVDLSTSATFASAVSGYPQTTVMTSWAPKALLANGTYYWRVRGLNSSGTAVATSDTWTFTIDSAPPTAVITPASGMAITGAFTATFSEPVTAVDGTGFRVLIAGTSTTVPGSVKVASPTVATFTPTSALMPGQTYTVVLDKPIKDLNGNLMQPTGVNVRTSLTVQESSVAVSEAWGKWSTGSANGGSMKLSRKGSTQLTYTFAGTSIALVGFRGPQGGYASIYLDGVLKATGNFYASSNRYKATIWSASGLAAGSHTLRVVPKGTKPKASSSTWVYVDAFRIDGPATVDDTNTAVRMQFRRVSTTSAYGSAYDLTNHKAATGKSGPALSFQFKGTSVTWYGTKGRTYGKAAVYIDGVKKATVDLYRSSTAYKSKVWASATLSNTVHTVRIVALGTKQKASKGYDVSFDQFVLK